MLQFGGLPIILLSGDTVGANRALHHVTHSSVLNRVGGATNPTHQLAVLTLTASLV